MARIQLAGDQSIKPYRSSEEYLYAMKEDLSEWLGGLYHVNMTVDNMMEALQTGTVLCLHANQVTRVGRDFSLRGGEEPNVVLPRSGVTFVGSAEPGTFLARDNISNFISWCRNEMGIQDVLMFETDDLVLRKNEKNFVLCLLEVARRASRFGMSSPILIQLEEEIDEELVDPQQKRQTSFDTANLDEMVKHLIARCTCPTLFPMVKVSEGKYKVGDSSTLIFVRILRCHVMVRVGGGWDTLEHYLDKHDPCRCTSPSHHVPQSPVPLVHHRIRGRLTPRPDSPGPVQQPSTLLLSRYTDSPLQHDPTTLSAPQPSRPARITASPSPSPETKPRTNRLNIGFQTYQPPKPTTNSSMSSKQTFRDILPVDPSRLSLRASSTSPTRHPRSVVSPGPGIWNPREPRACTPDKWRTSSPSLYHLSGGCKDAGPPHSSSRTGQEAPRSNQTPRSISTCPQPVSRPSTPQPRRTSTFPLSWTKSQSASKLKLSSASEVKDKGSTGRYASPIPGGRVTPRPSTPISRNMKACLSKTFNLNGPQTNSRFIVKADGLKNTGNIMQNVFRDTNNNNKAPKSNNAGDCFDEADFQYYKQPPGKANNQQPSIEVDFCKSVQQVSLQHNQERHRTRTMHNKSPPLSYKYENVNSIDPHRTVVRQLFQSTKSPKEFCVETSSNRLPNSSSCKERNKMVSSYQNVVASLHDQMTTHCVISDWPSVDSLVKSNDSYLDEGNGVNDNITNTTMTSTKDTLNIDADLTSTGNLDKSMAVSTRPRLRTPERVPSIYKLSYQLRSRPRCDHRPGKKPSRIPTPVSYKTSHLHETSWSRKAEQD